MASAVIGSLRVVLGIDTALFDKGLGDAMKSLKGIGKSMQSVGKSMSVFMTAPISAFGALTVKTAGDFEAALNRVDAATGASAAEFKAMRDMAVQLGAETIFSASESADAMEMLAKNGLTAGQILDGAVAASMKLAAASGSDLSASADVATDVMMNFGKEAKELGGLVDGITGVLLESKFGFDDYRLAIGQAGGVAGNLGVSFEDFNASIVATSAAFASGSDAGTSFKAFLTRLVPVSKEAAGAMEELDLSFFNADGSMKGMSEVAEELRTKMAGLSDQEMNEKMKTIFGVDAMRTAIMLMKTGGQGLDELKEKIGAASADEQAAARLKGFNGELEKLSGALESLQIAIADSGLLAMVTSFVSKLAGWVDALAETNPELLKWGTMIAGVAAALGPLVLTLGIVATAIAAIGAPVALVVAGIAAFTAALIAFWPEIQKIDQALMTWARNFDQSVVAMWDAGVAKIKAFGAAIVQFGKDVLAAFVGLGKQMYQIGAQIIQGLWDGLKSKFAAVKDGLTGFASGLVDSVKSKLGIHSPSKVMAEVGVNIMQGLSDGMSSMEGGITNMAESIGSTISSAFKGVIDGSKSVKEAIGDVLKSLASMLMDSGFKMLTQGLLGGLGGGGGFLGSLFGGLLGFANGGSFQVGGAGGVDSQIVAFRASPNERVDVTKPGQERPGGAQEVTIRGVFVDDNGVIKAQVTSMGRQAAQAGAQIGVRQVKQQMPGLIANAQARAL